MKRSKFAGRLCAVSLVASGMMMGCGAEPVDPTPQETGPKWDSVSKINAFLEGKTLVMKGENIPSHPNGFAENVNFGAATQCYTGVTMKVEAGNYSVVSEIGTLRDAPSVGNVGTCDRETKSTELTFTSTAALVENVKGNGECFDFTVSYPSFKQEGRGQFNADGTILSLELYFENKASGHRCADGAVGAKTVKVAGADFTGNAVQKYTVSAN